MIEGQVFGRDRTAIADQLLAGSVAVCLMNLRLRDPSLAAAFLAGHREYPPTGLCWLSDGWKPGPAAGWAVLFCNVCSLLGLSRSQSHLD